MTMVIPMMRSILMETNRNKLMVAITVRYTLVGTALEDLSGQSHDAERYVAMAMTFITTNATMATT